MNIKMIGIDKNKFSVDEEGNRRISLMLSEHPDALWTRLFERYYQQEPNNYKGTATIEYRKISIFYNYAHLNQVVNVYKGLVHTVNAEYNKQQASHELIEKQEAEKKQQKEQNRKKMLEDLKKGIEEIKFEDE